MYYIQVPLVSNGNNTAAHPNKMHQECQRKGHGAKEPWICKDWLAKGLKFFEILYIDG
jgi:hypothetical protein